VQGNPHTLRLAILPVDVQVGDCVATVLEVAKLALTGEYQASVQLRCGEVTSRVFHLTFRESKELERKLSVEAAKLRYALYLYGEKELRARGVVL